MAYFEHSVLNKRENFTSDFTKYSFSVKGEYSLKTCSRVCGILPSASLSCYCGYK